MHKVKERARLYKELARQRLVNVTRPDKWSHNNLNTGRVQQIVNNSLVLECSDIRMSSEYRTRIQPIHSIRPDY